MNKKSPRLLKSGQPPCAPLVNLSVDAVKAGG